MLQYRFCRERERYLMKDNSLWTLELSCCSKIIPFRLIFSIQISRKTYSEYVLQQYLHMTRGGHFEHLCTAQKADAEAQCYPMSRSPATYPTPAGILVPTKIQNLYCTTGLCSENSGQIYHSLLANQDFFRFPPFNSVSLWLN